MTMRGSLETFSLPELFQIIESGNKSGRLSFNPGLKNGDSRLQGVFELWFDRGDFVGIVNSLKYQSLIAKIQNNGWVDSKLLIRFKYSSPKDSPLGTYLEEEKLLDSDQINSLFQIQLDAARQLFNVSYAWFKFEELDLNNQILEDGQGFPWKEMTGKRKKPAELSLEAMRDFSDWERFNDDLPPADSGLQKLVETQALQLVALENHLWNTADGTVSLQNIAQETSISLLKVQQTALSMILAGLVEEVPVVNTAMKIGAIPRLSSQTALAGNSNIAIKPAVKAKVSNSLINNLVSFLRKNF